jgi:hypothetical protein
MSDPAGQEWCRSQANVAAYSECNPIVAQLDMTYIIFGLLSLILFLTQWKF